MYVIRYSGVIKYVGKTDAPSMSYGMRLRREFQETASSGKHNYPRLALLALPPEIMVSFFSSKAIDTLVKAEGLTLNAWGKVEVFETTSYRSQSILTPAGKLQNRTDSKPGSGNKAPTISHLRA